MIIIDNYDSFTYNIVQYIKMLGIEPQVYKNDEITVDALYNINFSSIILSPGPGRPKDAGITLDVIKNFYKTKSILGVCLGHQCIAEYFGAKIIKDANPFHGKCSNLFFDENEQIFNGFEQGLSVMRYHSLYVEKNSLKPPLKALAFMGNGVLAALRHETLNIYGVQFHPESILTENGISLFRNFIDISKNSRKFS